jgi:hypothetical protein
VNSQLILNLVGLRYKLLWAKTRSRNGRIALFLSGYLLLLMLIMLMAFGGFGAAMAAVQSGKALAIAQAALAGLFIQAVISTNLLGFGMSTIFSETELRRYPLTASDRRLARHLTGILDPFWFLFLALELGLALGLFGLGASGFWAAITAVLLLFVCNYLCARVVAAFVDRMMKRKGGATILLALIMMFAVLPGPLATLFKKRPELAGQLVAPAAYTPPFGAARAMVLHDSAAAAGFATLVAWIVVFLLVLVWLENRPPERQAAVSTKLTWESPFDRVGAFFGPSLGPFVAHWLRFYGRNGRTRTMAMLSIPLAAFLTYSTSRTLGPDGIFIAALGTISMATFLGTSRIAVNQFGYSGGAFRRYFLLPTAPGVTLRAASYAALALGAASIPITLALWLVLAPVPFDPRRVAMLLATGLTGLFLFNAAGLWVTLYNPRKGNYDSNFGNDLSLGGNVVLIGSMLCALLLPRALHHWFPSAVSPESWLLYLPLPLFAAVLYRISLGSAGRLFSGRREKLLAVVEGRD